MKHARPANIHVSKSVSLAAALLFSTMPWSAASAQTSSPAPSAPPASAAKPITPYLNVRYRLETVDQDGFAESATASTLRLRAGLRTATWNGVSAVVEGEAILRVGPDNYNDTVNGNTRYPLVVDPSDVLLNQAYLRWQPIRQVDAIVGRQTINLDNQRWVGSVDWRQNDQTLDAIRVGISPTPTTRVDYVHSWRVNRIFGPDSPQGIWRHSDIQLLHGSAVLAPVGTLAAYGYWLDLPAAPSSSSRTLGARLSGERVVVGKTKLVYALEYARQRDFGANTGSFRHDYVLVEPGVASGPVTVRVGYEKLGGDGRTALQTPLATLHAFNGWTDKFLTTPPNGLRDLYADIQWKLGPLFKAGPATLRFQLHDFNSARGHLSYGREAGVWMTMPVTKHVTSMVKVSHYYADAFATDTTKFWLGIEARY